MVLNAGELADSLGFPPEENPHIGMLLDLFSDPATNPHCHKLLLVTKAGLQATQAHLAGRTPSENAILSWSVGNAQNDEPYWSFALGEAGRVAAADWAAWRGWQVRLRLDPIIVTPGPILHWAAHIVQDFREDNGPELITLGTLRHRGGRPKLPAPERASIYRAALEGLRAGGYEGEIGLCKETPEMIRDVLAIEPETMRCNCTP